MADSISLMLCGDVMTGRGIDQVLPRPSEPILFESSVKSAIDYVEIAERANGPLSRPVPFDYVWGDALDVLAQRQPTFRIANLETAVTRAPHPWPKGINYRMNPDNIRCLTTFGIDCWILANNHVIDWGREGLLETVEVLQRAGLKTAGAGRNREEAAAPAILPAPLGGRVIVYAFACLSSGVPAEWAADHKRSGLNFLSETTKATAQPIANRIIRDKRPGDVVVCSVHWGPNWGYDVPADQRGFAHELVESGAVDIVHGHSSHHPKAMEVHQSKPIFYGCGDLLNDYEGIEGYEAYRGDLALIYLVEIEAKHGTLASLTMIPFRIRNFRLNRPELAETIWLQAMMDRECRRFGGQVRREGSELRFSW